jgi:hypothetical protein
VTALAKAKLPGGTIVRVETDADKQFEVVSVESGMPGRPGQSSSSSSGASA